MRFEKLLAGICLVTTLLSACGVSPNNQSAISPSLTSAATATPTPAPANPNAPYPIDVRWGPSRECPLTGDVDGWVTSIYFAPVPDFAVGLNTASINQPTSGYVGQPATGCTVTGIALPCLNSMHAETQTSANVTQGVRAFLHAADRFVLQVSLATGNGWLHLNNDPNGISLTVSQIYQAGSVVMKIDRCHTVDIRPATNSDANLSVGQ